MPNGRVPTEKELQKILDTPKENIDITINGDDSLGARIEKKSSYSKEEQQEAKDKIAEIEKKLPFSTLGEALELTTEKKYWKRVLNDATDIDVDKAELNETVDTSKPVMPEDSLKDWDKDEYIEFLEAKVKELEEERKTLLKNWMDEYRKNQKEVEDENETEGYAEVDMAKVVDENGKVIEDDLE